MGLIRMRYATVEYTSFGCTTRLIGYHGQIREVSAWPHDLPDYREISRRCGYDDDTMAYCREHEVMHSFLAERLFDAPSVVLLAEARGLRPRKGPALLEEMGSQMAQRWVRAGERPIIAWFDWDQFKQQFLELVGQ